MKPYMYPQVFMIKTFHSVGHGCFCTERFHNGLTVVYDCGGLVNRKILENESMVFSLRILN